jgi:UDP-N-acetyl-D-mannosaminuronic acid transferase (WecB/TagA/CpsF family)
MTAGSTQRNPHARDAAHVLGCRIDRLDMEMTLHRIEDVIERREYVQHVAINAAKLVAMRDDEDLRRIVEDCGLVNAGGQAVVWASPLLGDPLPERVAGVDLMLELSHWPRRGAIGPTSSGRLLMCSNKRSTASTPGIRG